MPKTYNIDNSWISATATHHYMMADPLLDWLDYHSKHPKSPSKLSIPTKSNSTYSYITNQGHIFEAQIVTALKDKFGTKVLEIKQQDYDQAINSTIAAMKRGTPIIHGGVVYNNSNKTFGITDLLVRSDWICKLVDNPPDMQDVKAPSWGHKYHYRVVDIKYTCLPLRADGIHLLNSGLFPAYKAQLLIYTQALGKMQGYTPNTAYILGRRWMYEKFNVKFSDDYCFSRLGVIDYSNVDRSFITSTAAAIAWLKEVRQPASKTWNVTKYPLSRWELYPNMCNIYDEPWHEFKVKLAQSQNELTLLWMVGPRNRQIALQSNICKWTDKKCKPASLGIRGPKVGAILQEIIDINQQTRVQIKPKYVNNNIGNWKYNKNDEFFIDFETTNGAFAPLTDGNNFPEANTSVIAYMIGIGHENKRTKKWTYVNYTINNKNDETAIFRKMAEYINSRSDQPQVYHWGNAEMVQIRRINDELFHQAIDHWNFVDMLRIFKEEPIVIKGCMSFGLKDVAKTLHKHGKINTIWAKHGCQDGENAMLVPYISGMMKGSNSKPWSVIAYNEVDTRVLYEILKFLRTEHCQAVKVCGKRKREETTVLRKRTRHV